jgi:hypothetical protein
MIHPRRGSGVLGYRVALGLIAVCAVVTAAAVATGAVTIGLQVPWKGIATLVALAAIALVARLRRTS